MQSGPEDFHAPARQTAENESFFFLFCSCINFYDSSIACLEKNIHVGYNENTLLHYSNEVPYAQKERVEGISWK